MQQNPVQRALEAGLSPNFRTFAVPVCALRFCADGARKALLKRSWSRNHLPHRRLQHAASIPGNREHTVGDGTASSLRMDPPTNPRGSLHLDKPWTDPAFRQPCPMSFIRLLSLEILSHFAGPHAAWTPDPILSFSSSVEHKKKETMAKRNGAPAKLKTRKQIQQPKTAAIQLQDLEELPVTAR